MKGRHGDPLVATLIAVLVSAPGALGAQPRPAARRPRPPAPAATPDAGSSTAIVRNTAAVTGLGEFGSSRPALVVPSTLESTGSVASERGPTTELRANVASPTGGGPHAASIVAADLVHLVRDEEPRLRACYDTAPAARRRGGRVELRFTIGRTGEVTEVQVTGLEAAREIEVCMADRLRATRFPPPAAGILPYVHAITLAPARVPPPALDPAPRAPARSLPSAPPPSAPPPSAPPPSRR